MAPYDDFAWFYNRYWNEEFHSLAFPILERIWLGRIAPHARILDVCCGTGYLAGLLVARGHSVTGIDASASMVRHARENVRAAEFDVADAAEFRLAPPFDAAVSTFDSLNHFLTAEQLQAVFRNIALSLESGAPFAFDMLMEEAYQTRWGEAFALVRDDHLLTITGAGYDFRTRKARCLITMFRQLQGVWRRSDVEIEERCFTPREIEAALTEAGFESIVCCDARALGMAGEMGKGRTFYVATRV